MFNLIWLIPLLPLLAFAAIVLFAHRSNRLSHSLAIGAVALSWLLGWGVFFQAWGTGHMGHEPPTVFLWTIPTGEAALRLGFMADRLTALLLFMVPFVCLMIFIYSVGYMQGDPRYARFFAYISLFAAGMLGLVVADNLVALFVFWEIMGLCSYLLISFWFEKEYPDPRRITPKEAGLKAFLTTRIGDVLFLSGMLLLYARSGSLTFGEILSVPNLKALAESTVTLPLLGTMPWATLIAILIFGGAVGKSAQFPLHVWLPDAMEGPTPVSALIHAATMVSAGVFLVARMFPLFSAVEGGAQLGLVAFIGAFSALMTATIGLAQNDIKRVLAYSTISQLGYMFAALGIGAYVAAVFHLITHAFFKALLFLGSGSVIHGVEHGHHALSHQATGHEEHGKEHAEAFFDANDMMNMGGLRRRMPWTFLTFLIGTLALAGIVPFAGFWSKDEILADAWEKFLHEGVASWPFFVWLLLTAAAFLTAFYMGRQIFLTFGGEPRTEAARHAHESPPTMTVPLIVLALFAALLGLAGTPWANLFQRFVGEEGVVGLGEMHATPFVWEVALISTLVAAGGLFCGWLLYGRRPLRAGQPDPLARALGPIHTVLRNKYYFDELYAATIIRFARWLADFSFRFDDRWIIDPIVDAVGAFGRSLSAFGGRFDIRIVDGIVNGVAEVSDRAAGVLRLVQTGRVQNYLLAAMLAVLALLGFYLAF